MYASHSKSKSKSKSKKDNTNTNLSNNYHSRKISQKKINGIKKFTSREKSSNKTIPSDLISPKTIEYSKCKILYYASNRKIPWLF
jgi:hypothetical protein